MKIYKIHDGKNRLVIDDCADCINWTPADSYGCGCYCTELNKVVHEPICEDMPIPDECPRLTKKIKLDTV